MASRVRAKVAYFSMDPKNPLVRSHLKKGGIAAVYEEGYISILQQDWLHRIEKAEQVPLTMGGRAPFMIANALAASLAGFVQGVKIEQIRLALQTFQPSASQIPGRMNLFNMGSFHALVDYAHNPAGYAAVGSFVKNWPGPSIGVIGAPGDRRDEDLRNLGKLSASIFDQVVIKEDKDTRGRELGTVSDLIAQGIADVEAASGELFSHTVQLDESEAINWALDNAPDNGLVVILPEKVSDAIALISAKGPVSEGFSMPAETEDEIVIEPVVKSTARVPNKAMAFQVSSHTSTSEVDLADVRTASDLKSLNGSSPASSVS